MKHKALLIASVFVLTLALSAFLVSCNPEKMEKIVGTYKLVTDTRTEYEQETVDNIAKYGKEAYIVLTGKDYGYYVYKDNDTPAFAREVKLEYSKNDKDQVTSVSYVLEVGGPVKSFNVDSKDRIALISRWPSATKHIAAYDVQFNKIGNATDLSAVKKVYGDLPVFGFDLYRYNSMFCAELTNGHNLHFSKYIYRYYDVNSAACTATLYYATKDDKVPVVETNLTVSFERNSENDKPIKMKIGNVEYDLTSGVPSREVKVNIGNEEFDGNEELSWFYLSQTEYSDWTTYFQSLLDDYDSSLKDSEQT